MTTIKFATFPANKVEGVSLGLRAKGKEKLGLTPEQQVGVIGEVPSMKGIAALLKPEQVNAIIESLAEATQFELMRDSIASAGAVPATEFPVAGWIDQDSVFAELWKAYDPATKGTRGAGATLTAEQVEALYSEELLPVIDAAIKSKNPTVSALQLSKAHALYAALLAKLFSRAAINAIKEDSAVIIGEKLLPLVIDGAGADSFAMAIANRLASVLEAQEAKAKKQQEDANIDLL